MEFKTEVEEEVSETKQSARETKGGGIAPLPVAREEAVVVARDGGASRRGKRRGGRANLRGTHKRPRPRTIDELVTSDITEIKDGQSLLTPLHPKRTRKPITLVPAPPPPPPPPPSSTASTSTSQQYDGEVVVKDESVSPVPEIAPPLSPPVRECSVPSPVMDGDSAPSSTPASPLQHPPRRSRKNLINFGSEAGSDDSDDEEAVVFPAIPRVFRSIIQTYLDQEEDAADDPAPASDPPTATDQPWRWYDFEWTQFPDPPISPESRRETFSQSNVGPTTPCVDPYDIFVAIWDRQIMEHIVSETNKYAQQVATQMLKNHTLRPGSRIGKWCDITVHELYVYFGLILAMGIVIKSRMEEYWTASPDVFCTPGFSAHMSIDRFKLLSKCLHFNDNEAMCALELDPSEARLYKIQPLLSHLNLKFQSLYTPAQNIALDESLLMLKGQLISNKPATVGIKTYEICESQTGYLWRFEIHAHKKSPPQQVEDPLEATMPSIILRLIQGLEHKGYTLCMDNFYNSPCLARHLKSLGFDCVGTLRTDHKFFPQALRCLTKQNMRPGQITGLTSGDVDVMVWRDNCRVTMISTYHGNSQQSVRGSIKPKLILDYNYMMAGLDKKDQMLAIYPVERKQTTVWYKKLFKRLLNVSVFNSYMICKHTSSSVSHRNFRIALVKSLLSKHCAPPLLPATTQKQRRRIDRTHHLN